MPQAPTRITPAGPADYLEVLTRAVFQSGMSGRVIEAKWDGFRAAFEGFDPERVAAMGPDDVDRLAADERIVRNRRKIEATIENAATLAELNARPGGFGAWLGSLGGFDEQVAELRRRFRFVGDFGAYYFLHVVGQPTPSHEEFLASRK